MITYLQRSIVAFALGMACLAAPAAEAQNSPDLVVGTPSVSDSSPAPRVVFTLSVTVRNDGGGSASATTLRYYQSTDATITTSDFEEYYETAGALDAGATSSWSVNFSSPSSAGTYYYGACVDEVVGESDTTNNCSGSVAITVEEPAPDLIVLGPSVGDNTTLETGQTFRMLVTVQNQGDVRAEATTVRYLQSTDETITTTDMEVGTDAVNPRNPGTAYGATTRLTAPSIAGTYYYGACVDAVAGESDITNNCSTSVQVDVSEPPVQTSPDLMVGAPLVSDSSLVAGAAFTLSAEVRNGGDGASAATTLRYYQSADSAITASDTEVGMDAVATLAASGTNSQSVELTAPAAGTYYYGACVDAVAGVSDTSNNCSTSVQVDVSQPVPALALLAQLLLALGLAAAGARMAARPRQH